MTNEEMVALKDDLYQRLRTALDQFIGGQLSEQALDQIKTTVQNVLLGWTTEQNFSADTLGFEFDITVDPQGSISFTLQPFGFLAQQFVEATPPAPAPPDKRKLRGFNPLWGGDPEPEPVDEGVPPVAKPDPRWFDGSDPFLRVKG
tara:strand:+ start:929 stop:1366 length:438 start_codon:yes stop_codon:yes gene_type:complete